MNDSAEAMSDMRPAISVIMPCYNSEKYLGEAVDCVLNQTYPHTELIVIDDGSTDRSLEILASYGDKVKVLTQEHQGPFPARNLGLAHATGTFVAFLDSDDWWTPEALEKLHQAIEKEDADIAYCGWQNVGEIRQGEPYVPPPYEQEDIVQHFIRSCPWPIHGALVRRALINRIGGFSTHRFSAMDYDFWLRSLAESRGFVRVPEVLAFYRWHGDGQISSMKWRQVLDALAAQQEFARDNPDLVKHIPADRLLELTEGQVLRQGYLAFWRRDLTTAQKLFRHAFRARSWQLQDLRHVVTALLPLPIYRRLVEFVESTGGG